MPIRIRLRILLFSSVTFKMAETHSTPAPPGTQLSYRSFYLGIPQQVQNVPYRFHSNIRVESSVTDPWHLSADPDPRIRTYLWHTDPARILLFLTVTKTPTKINFFLTKLVCLFLFEGTCTPFFKDKSHKEFTNQFLKDIVQPKKRGV